VRLRQGLDGSLATLLATTRFFGRRYPVMFAFGVGVSVQRLISVAYPDLWPPAAGVAGETFTLTARLLFLGWVARALLRQPGLTTHAPRRLSAFARRDWPVLVGHLVLLAAATLVFNAVLEGGGAALLPESARPTFLAWVLAVKNVTVIPFTLVWLVMMVRDALRRVPEVVPPVSGPQPHRAGGGPGSRSAG